MGASILEPMITFQQFVPIVRWHHERWDGRGYPDGLKGAQIPIEAQIVAMADRFDELQHERPLPEAEALRVLTAEAEGGAFDKRREEMLPRQSLLSEPRCAAGP